MTYIYILSDSALPIYLLLKISIGLMYLVDLVYVISW